MHEFYTKNSKILLNKWTATCIIIDWKTQRCKDVSFHHCHVSYISQGCECKDFSPFYPCELFSLRLSCEFMRLRWTNLRERLVEKPESPLPFDSGSIVTQSVMCLTCVPLGMRVGNSLPGVTSLVQNLRKSFKESVSQKCKDTILT